MNFEANINCNTIKTNVPKWRKTCTGLKFDLFNFYGPQSHILSGDTLYIITMAMYAMCVGMAMQCIAIQCRHLTFPFSHYFMRQYLMTAL